MENNETNKREEALAYHADGRPGKIEVVPTKPYSTQKDLSMAYSPGVAEPCLEIEAHPEDAYKYTAKGNLVAVISNGTAVLGLGNIGAMAGKPVMEGKGLLFKTFADIDVFDIEVNTQDTEKFIETVKNISVTFGGINLEDIKAPECFIIEERLKEELSIPVMHDDQHGTAIISAAALLNALEIAGKNIHDVQVVVNGAGAAAVSEDEAVPVTLKTAPVATDGVKMSKVEILFKQERFESLKNAMKEIGITGMTVSNVLGCGMQRGKPEYYRGVKREIDLLPKMQMDIVVSKIPVSEVIAAAKKALYTGHIGDGKIFVYNVENVVKIRTGEDGYDALQDVE